MTRLVSLTATATVLLPQLYKAELTWSRTLFAQVVFCNVLRLRVLRKTDRKDTRFPCRTVFHAFQFPGSGGLILRTRTTFIGVPPCSRLLYQPTEELFRLFLFSYKRQFLHAST